MKEELVSIIMPTYNAGKYLADSIRCIQKQTYQNWELLITDDASNDEQTALILRKFALEDSRIKIMLLTENHGPGYARNKSIERANGRYISFCDCDDRWTPDKLEVQIEFMLRKKCAISCASYVVCNGNYEEIGINIPPQRITYGMMKRDNKIGCLTAIYDTLLLGKKYYMPTIRKRQDWAMFLEIMRDSKVCYAYTDKPLAFYCIRQNSVSSDKHSLIKYNVSVYKDILGFSSTKAHAYFYLLFMPTYGMKVLKRKIDSWRYMKNLENKK